MKELDRRGSAIVERVLRELDVLEEAGVLLLAELWFREDDQSRRRAWRRAKEAIERAGLSDVLTRAREGVGEWMLASPQDYQGISGILGRDGDHVAVRRIAAPAVLDAVVALLAEGDLHSADYDVLARPWQKTMAGAGDSVREPD